MRFFKSSYQLITENPKSFLLGVTYELANWLWLLRSGADFGASNILAVLLRTPIAGFAGAALGGIYHKVSQMALASFNESETASELLTGPDFLQSDYGSARPTHTTRV